jgi:Beta-propeller repeat/Abnormal spindle-like microcephaly-assoc'd, ASPM-SPD-2-Hydin
MKTRIRWASFTACVLAGSVVLSLLLITVIRRNTSNLQKTITAQPSDSSAITPKWEKAYANLPMGFEENRGQAAREVSFVAHGSGYALALTPQETDITLLRRRVMNGSPLNRAASLRALRAALKAQSTTVIRMQLEGVNPSPKVAAADKLPGQTNYFVGNDPKKWVTDVPSYARVKYSGIYPGVDLVFYGNQRHLEYDFVIAPGADPKSVKLKIEGAQKLAINSRGDLTLSVSDGDVEFKKPVIYQTVGSERREIAGNYAVSSDNRVTFAVSAYDKTLPLVIDPLLNYSTYLGGTGDETGFGIAVDSAGDAFVAGSTSSTDFPTIAATALQKNAPATGCGYLTEISPTGATQLYSTYLCGTSGADQAFAVAVDTNGKVYVAGSTSSTDFPTMNGLTTPAANPGGAAFVTKLDTTLSGAASLLYSSYVGGTSGDFANAVAADGSGNAYLGGDTFSNPGAPGSGGFPVTTGAFQATPQNTFGTAFLTRIDTTQSGNAGLIYSTYFGGNGANNGFLPFGEEIRGVAVDTSNNAYVTGVTTSTDFPAVNAFRGTAVAGNIKGAAFVSRFDTTKANAASLTYSTYLEGSTLDAGLAIALGPSNVAYVTGSTESLDFPTTTGAFQTVGAASGVAFVSLIDTTLSGVPSLKYSTFLGGTGSDNGFGIQADSLGAAYVVGTTASTDFPITPGALPSTLPNSIGAAFVAKLNPGGNGKADRVYATYFGGSGDGGDADQGFGIAVDTNHNAFITGVTFSGDMPTTAGAFQTSLKGPSDAYVAKLPLLLPVVVSPASLNFGTQLVGATTAPQTVTLTNNNATALTITNIKVVATAPPAAATDYAILGSSTCPTGGGSVAAGASCTVDVTFKPSVAAAESAKLVFTDVDPSSPQSVTLTGTGSANAPVALLTPASLTFTGQLVTTTSAGQPVTLKNNGNATLNIASITASGDFAVSTPNPCGATLAAGASCMPSVTFKPTATGNRTGTLTVTDDANGSPQTVALSGTGTDFTVTAPAAVTVSRGSNMMFNVTVTPISGFNQAVALTCTGAPSKTTCAVAGSPVTPDGVNPITAQVTVTSTSLLPSAPTRTPPPSGRQIVLIALGLALLAMVFATQRLRTRLGLAGAMLVVFAVAGCSGSPKPTTTNITLTGTSNGVMHTATVALTVD